MSSVFSPDAFMAAAPSSPLNGNTAWAQRYAQEVKRVITTHAKFMPRNVQQHLGPSELGVACDRQVAGKMAGFPDTNHVTDPWPSWVGTACHAHAEDAFNADNARSGVYRWITERRVTPHPDHPGTADLYDGIEQAVGDHKFLGKTTLEHVKAKDGPPRKYVVQLILYGQGYRNMGLPVKRVALIAYPRTAGSLDGLYVWDREHTSADDDLIHEVFEQTAVRKAMAQELIAGRISLNDIPSLPSDDECYFCPFYRPQSATDGGVGCPGTVATSRA